MKTLGRTSRSRFATVGMTIVATSAFVIGMTTAFANHDDPDQIHACVKNNGQIRIVSDPSICTNNESVLDWSRGAGTGQGVTGHEIVTKTLTSADDGVPVSGPGPGGTINGVLVEGDATCPAGKKVFGGGATADPVTSPFASPNAIPSTPSASGTSWHASHARNVLSTPPWTLTIYAICADAS